jgi:ATP-dependent DNA ligase
LLKKIISKTDIQFSESFEIDGREMYKHACKTGLEGVVSKVRDSRYVSGRVNHWVKKTCAQRETLAIAGFALDGKKWDGIYLGRRKGKELIYAGKVDNGFDAATAKDLQARLKPLIRETQPYAKKNRPSWHLGRAVAACRDRIPSEVSRGQGASSVLQGNPGGFMSWRVALMWGTVIVAVVLGVLAAAYLLIQTFVFG